MVEINKGIMTMTANYMSEKLEKHYDIHDKIKRLTAAGLIALGAIGLAGCEKTAQQPAGVTQSAVDAAFLAAERDPVANHCDFGVPPIGAGGTILSAAQDTIEATKGPLTNEQKAVVILSSRDTAAEIPVAQPDTKIGICVNVDDLIKGQSAYIVIPNPDHPAK